MDHLELLTDSQAAKILNCPVGELPQRIQQGQIESVALRGDQRYRLVKRPQGQPGDSSTPESPGGHPIKTDKLVRQYEERGKIIQLLEKNHSLHLKKLFSRIKRLRQHRLSLIIALEVLVGVGIIAGTLAHDKLQATRSQAADSVLMAQHHEKQNALIRQDQQEVEQQYGKITERLNIGQLEQARLENQLSIQDSKIAEARKMISQLIQAVEFSRPELASK